MINRNGGRNTTVAVLQQRAAEKVRQAMRIGVPALVIGTVAIQGLSFMVQLLLARILPPSEFGAARAAEAVIATALQLSYCGMPSLMIRSVAALASGGSRRAVVGRLATLAACSGAIVSILVIVLAPWFVPPDALVPTRILAGSLAFTSVARTLVNYFYGLRDPQRAARIAVPITALAAAVILVMAGTAGLRGWSMARVGGEAFIVAVLCWHVAKDFRGEKMDNTLLETPAYARRTLVLTGLPLSLSLLCRSGIDNLPVLAFAKLGRDAGSMPALGVATLLAAVLMIVPSGVITLALPRMVERVQDRAALRAFFYHMAVVVLALAALPAIPFTLSLSRVVPHLASGYEHGLAEASLILLIVPLRAFSSLCGTLLLAVEHSIESVYATVAVFILALFLQVLLAPQRGVGGTILASFLSEVASVTLLWRAAHRHVR